MYNRYIPQSDGSYRRSRMPDQLPQQPPQPQRPQQEVVSDIPPTQEACPTPCPHKPVQKPLPHPRGNRRPQRPAYPPQKSEPVKSTSVGNFLKNLLPGDFDTSDLLVVLLLLLMSADSQEDQNTSLLTLVLYLFL